MPRPRLIRTVSFRATHRYWRDDWTEERNREAFGEQVVSHGHDYRLQITVGGDVDPETGFLVDLGDLDRVLAEVVAPLEGRELNEVVPEIREGRMQPSTEELALWFWRRLEGKIPGRARLERVRLHESDGLAAEVERTGERA